MRILGIDPGYATTGFGILEAGCGSVQLLNYGTITTPTTLTFPERLVVLYDDMTQLIETVKPDAWRSRSCSGAITSRPASA